MSKFTVSIEVIGPRNKLGVGKQGTVYAVPDFQTDFSVTGVFKEYKREALGDLNATILMKMVAYLRSLPFADGVHLTRIAAWPECLVERGGAVVGFVMPQVPRDFYFTRIDTGKETLGQFQHLVYNNREQQFQVGIRIADRARYELLSDVASGLAFLHSHDISVGDLSPNNLLFSVGPVHRAYCIDTDSMRFKGESALPQHETPDWEVRRIPSSEELATAKSDIYKYGLLILRVLGSVEISRSASDLPKAVPKEVRRLVAQSLLPTPNSRPSASDWMEPLKKAVASADTSVTPSMATVSSSTKSTAARPQRAPARATTGTTIKPQITNVSPGLTIVGKPRKSILGTVLGGIVGACLAAIVFFCSCDNSIRSDQFDREYFRIS